MRKKLVFALLAVGAVAAVGCKAGKGCPTSGKAIGAERILSGDPKAMKAVKKAPKFKS